jgi:hypothetical protein
MLTTANVKEFKPGLPRTYAFRIYDEITKVDMEAMSARMNDAFDRDAGKVDMLLVFRTGKTSELGSGWTAEAIKAQGRSLTNVRNYVVANAPGQAGGIVETMGKVMPVEAKSFDTEEDALVWLKSQPRPEAA